MTLPTLLTRGRDLSAWNDEHDWESDTTEFAMLRLFEWRSGVVWGADAQLARNLVESTRYGKVVGGYHRVDPTRWTPQIEARRMIGVLNSCGLLAPGRMRPAVDIERTGKPEDAKVDWPRWTRSFFEEWRLLTICPLRVYAAGGDFGSLLGGLTDWPSWVDGWVGHTTEWSSPTRNMLPDEWAGRTKYTLNGRATLHQYAKPPAAPTDLDCFMPGKTWVDAILQTV
jgi:hypothetical protein